jgi:hypothetical protein
VLHLHMSQARGLSYFCALEKYFVYKGYKIGKRCYMYGVVVQSKKRNIVDYLLPRFFTCYTGDGFSTRHSGDSFLKLDRVFTIFFLLKKNGILVSAVSD